MTTKFKTLTKSKLAEHQQRWKIRNKQFKQQGMPTETFEEYLNFAFGLGKKVKQGNDTYKLSMPEDRIVHVHKKSYSWEPCLKKETPKYTGTALVGVSTMHKSNAIPVFSVEEAISVSKMRR